MSFQAAICKNVLYGHATFGKSTSNENSSVAVQWFFLSTHQNNTVLVRSTDHAVDTAAEQIRLCQSPVLNASMLIARQGVRPGTKCSTQKHVLDAFRLQVTL